MSIHHGLRSAAGASVADPDFKNVSLLLLGNGSNGGQNNTFTDGSSNAFSITRYGNTTQGTFSPFAYNWGVNTGDGSYPTCSYTAFNSVSGDFTIECWAFIQDAGRSIDSSKYGNFFAGGATGSTSNIWAFTFLISGGVITQLILQADNSDRISLTGLSISINTWHHFAMVRSGSTITIYVDGASAGSGTYSGTINSGSTGRTVIGQGSYGGSYANYLKGTISNVRFVVGTAVYTTNFTPATTNLTAITNTTLLTCQDNRFKDNSTNAFAISVTGSPSVTNFAPFATGSEYSTGTNGGSGYFDGSGDYLSIPYNSAFDFGTGDFTIEAWIYLTAAPAAGSCILGSLTTDGTDFQWRSSTTIALGSNANAWRFTSNTTTFPLNTWFHIAVTRASGTAYIWLNGASIGSGTETTSFNAQSGAVLVGRSSDGYFAGGYISSLRVTKTAQYTSAFTPSTSPITAITNTSLLLNFTNASIIDSTGKNNLETVGDAQIDTGTKKYGTGSLKFDGTGDYLAAPSSSNFGFGTGDFTVEAWCYIANTTGVKVLFDSRITSNSNGIAIYTNGSTINAASGGTQIISGGTLSANSWFHIALVRNGTGTNGTTLYLDGTSIGSATLTTSFNNTSCYLGNSYLNEYWNGYIDDLRISKVARYTAAFTPPSRQLPAR